MPAALTDTAYLQYSLQQHRWACRSPVTGSRCRSRTLFLPSVSCFFFIYELIIFSSLSIKCISWSLNVKLNMLMSLEISYLHTRRNYRGWFHMLHSRSINYRKICHHRDWQRLIGVPVWVLLSPDHYTDIIEPYWTIPRLKKWVFWMTV